MVSLPFAGATAAPAVRRPVLAVRFGSGSADDWRQAIVSVTAEAGLAPSTDVVQVHVAATGQAPSAVVGDTGSVALGYEDSGTEPVFTGQVASVRYGIQGTTRITATNGGALLSALRVNQSYEQQKAGDIVRDLAGRAEVGAGTIEDGVAFPFYVVDDRRSAYQHIAALARKSGYLAWFTPDGRLSFAPFQGGQAVQTFTYGVDVLALEVTEAAPVVGTVTTFGEGAAGSQGQDAWNWLVKDPSSVKGSAGEGAPERQVQDPSLRSRDASQSAAGGAANAAGLVRLTGRLLASGAPAVVGGSAVEIANAPQTALNGLCLVRGVRHHFAKREGFTTLITFSKTGAAGPGGLLGGLL